MRKLLEKIGRINLGYIWLVGAFVFLPSIVHWICFVWWIEVKLEFDSTFFRALYLPMFAAVLGVLIPTVFLIRLKKIEEKKSFLFFVIYAIGMLSWGFLDIKNENCQIRGLVDPPKYYGHVYITWYFLPYRSIHNYKFD